MNLDGVVILSLVIVLLTGAIIIYLGLYAYKHIKSDVAQIDKDNKCNE
jgi:hypothetical protein